MLNKQLLENITQIINKMIYLENLMAPKPWKDTTKGLYKASLAVVQTIMKMI